MLVPNRHGSSNSYRYGFQGQEKDDELKGEGNSLNYTFRMHDPRVGRFFAVDPLFRQYAYNSPYAFSENRVMQFNELEGRELDQLRIYAKNGVFGKTVQNIVVTTEDITEEVVRSTASAGLTVGSAIFVPIVNQANIVRTEGVHAGGALKKSNYVFEPGVYKLDSNWNIVNMGINNEANIEVAKSTVQVLTTFIPIEMVAVKVATPFFKAGSHLITKGSRIFGGAKILLNSKVTTTVLGRFKGGVEYVKATGMFRMGENNGGINILNISDDAYKKVINEGGDDLFWKQYNQPWLDDAIKRGDNIRLVSDPSNPSNLFINGVDDSAGRTMFGREVQHLENNGYKFEGAKAVKE